MGTELVVNRFWVSKVSLFLCQKGNSCSIHQQQHVHISHTHAEKYSKTNKKNVLKYFNGLYSWHGMYIVLMIQNVRQERQKNKNETHFCDEAIRKFLCFMQQHTNRWMTRRRQCKNLSFDNYAKSVSFNMLKKGEFFLRVQKHTRRKAIMFIIYCVSFNIQPKKKTITSALPLSFIKIMRELSFCFYFIRYKEEAEVIGVVKTHRRSLKTLLSKY